MSPVEAVIFDMDGVLIDSEPLHLRATQLTLGDRGPSYTERDNRAFFGATDAEHLRILRILFNLRPTTEELVEAKIAHLLALIRAEGRPLPGVPAVPRRLQETGMRLGLISSSARPVIGAVLETLGLDAVFRTIVSGDEVARSQPAPDGFLMAARRLAVDPQACLVIEGSRNGVLAAKAAGMSVTAVPCQAASHEELSPADLVLPSLDALLKAMEENGDGLPGHSESRR